uniref:Uncharacterized protein n=1 Tax=Timema tahoe TaxID=61484 RepID=A0A7R9ITX9_9NEOP|nr:unnamed protein product [Timema tahoe]
MTGRPRFESRSSRVSCRVQCVGRRVRLVCPVCGSTCPASELSCPVCGPACPVYGLVFLDRLDRIRLPGFNPTNQPKEDHGHPENRVLYEGSQDIRGRYTGILDVRRRGTEGREVQVDTGLFPFNCRWTEG